MDSDVQVGCGLLGGSGQVPGGGPGGQLGGQQGEGGQEVGQAQQLGGGEGGGGVPRDVGQPSGHLEEAQPCLQACQEVQDQRPPQHRSSRGGAGCRCSPRCSLGISRTPTLPGNQSQQGISCQQSIPSYSHSKSDQRATEAVFRATRGKGGATILPLDSVGSRTETMKSEKIRRKLAKKQGVEKI